MVARAIALAALVAAVVVVAVLLLRNGDTHTYHIRFQNAGQLVKDDDVQVGGRRIGSIDDITLTNDNQADVKISIDSAYAPLREGTTALIRQTSLSGVANRYITLTMAPNNARALDDGATISAEKSTSPVDLDQLFDTLDAKTRKGLQNVIQGGATQYKGKGQQANEAAEYFNPALSTTRALVNQATADQQALSDFLANGSAVTQALAQRSADITNLVTNANATTGAIARERAALSEDLQRLPVTLRRANTTFVNLRATLDDLDVLVDASKPATKRLAPLFRQLRPLVRDARPTIADLRALINSPGPDNDLTDLLNKAPSLARNATPAFKNGTTALRKSIPVLTFIRPYTPELVGFLRDFGQGASNYDANGHYARIQPIFNAFQLGGTPGGEVLNFTSPSSPLAGLEVRKSQRCPGGAMQPPPDGSAPYRETAGFSCDPSATPPGP
jgi:phospholipid/cholesterol/gamma-HCH transport system substrate-binding protein